MKLVISIIALSLSGIASFAPSSPIFFGRRGGVLVPSSSSSSEGGGFPITTIFAEPGEKEEEGAGGLDLDLSEMFDMCVRAGFALFLPFVRSRARALLLFFFSRRRGGW